ncbi:hypothetical protein LTR46_008697 [Exophiala xenobiotica]|nr:hypothetical protein LTR46_008697 [Exophiala xenobiotica]
MSSDDQQGKWQIRIEKQQQMSGRGLSVRLAISKPSTGYLRQTVVEQDGSFHFIPRVKDDLFCGGIAQFEWQGDNTLEVRVLAFKSEDQRKEIISRLLKFVTMLLDTNNTPPTHRLNS